MKDFLGNELQVGDRVVYVVHAGTHSWLQEGVIKHFTPKFIHLFGGRRKTPPMIVKYTGA